ncbi:MAG: radical SAM protein [Limnochordia bacterium]|jgi:DNA repair photolyase|nr:radical SAM protein [Limnochordia bacterium]MDD4517852.1 radical SAM protein [Limnochordia bacterium]
MHYAAAKRILSAHNAMNIYRGCTHGCIYCDSRSTCYQMKHDFEDIEVKINAPKLLEDALRRKRKKCMISTGAMCDPYMHCEQELEMTRKCLEIIDRYGFGLAIQTKSNRILRDLDLLQSIKEKAKCIVQMTLTTYDESLCRIIEPNVCTTKERHETLKILSDAGIPTVVWFAPLIPFINDTEENLRGILDYCFDAGVKGILCFGMGVTLRDGDREYFYAALDRHFPGLKRKYMLQYGYSYECKSDNEEELMRIFHGECHMQDVMCDVGEIFTYINEFPSRNPPEQLSLF